MPRLLLHNWLIVLLALLLGTVTPAFAEDDELETLGFTEPTDPAVVTTSHFPRPTSKTAENITVITAEDIARLNAHTLADILQTIPGIQLDYQRTPGSFTFFNIQGALNTTVLVMVDGIRQNDFHQNIALPGLIPVQSIERIEIIKGAASAAWGSALGGVINIITKTPNPERPFSGMASGSIGSQFTADSRAELSGTINRFGYYLTASNLRSDGFSPNTANNINTISGKISVQLPKEGKLTVGLSHLAAKPGLDEGDTASFGFIHDNQEFKRTNGFISLLQPLNSNLSLDVNAHFSNRNDHTKFGGLDNGAIVFFNDFNNRESSRGINSRLAWGDSQFNLIAGFEYFNAQAKSLDLLSIDPPTYDRKWDSWGLFANASYSIGKLTILPGIRHDMTGITGDNNSYSLGATYQLAESTTLRTYAAQGFSLPTLISTESLQKIKTIQAGIETGAVPHLWLKGTYYFNALRNSQSTGTLSVTNQNRQGFELEAKTTPAYNTSLSVGYTFLYATNSDTGARLKTDSSQTVPPHLVKLSALYNNKSLGLSGTLTGNFVYWSSAEGSTTADKGAIWDLHLNWKLRPKSDLSPELFFSGRNLFNGAQTTDTEIYRNTGRWFEGGVRVRF